MVEFALDGLGLDPGMLDELAERAEQDDIGKFFQFVGEFGTLLTGGLGALTIGRLASRRVGVEVSKKLAQEGADFLSGRLTNKALLSRMVEVAGESAGIAGFEGGRAAAEGKSGAEIAKQAAIGGGLVFGLGAGLTTGGRLLFPSARAHRPDKLLKALRETEDIEEAGTPAMDKIFREAMAGHIAEKDLALTKLANRNVRLLDDVEYDQLPLFSDRLHRYPGIDDMPDATFLATAPSTTTSVLPGSGKIVTMASGKPTRGLASKFEEVMGPRNPLTGEREIIKRPIFGTGVQTPVRGRADEQVRITENLVKQIKKADKNIAALEAQQAELKALTHTDPVFTRTMSDEPWKVLGRVRNLRSKGQVWDGVGWATEQLLAKFVMSPKALASRSGATMMKVVEGVQDMSTTVRLWRVGVDKHTRKLVTELGDELGFGISAARNPVQAVDKVLKDEKFLKSLDDIFKTYERGDTALTQKYGPRVMKIMNYRVKQPLAFLQKQAAESGGESALSATEMRAMGVGNYLPHILDDVADYTRVEENMVKILAKRGVKDPETALALGAYRSQGIKKLNSVDFQRKFSGTLDELTKEGVPFIRDPIRMMRAAMENHGIRQQMVKRWGPDLAGIEAAKRVAIEVEGANPAFVNTMMDHIFFQRYSAQATKALAGFMTDMQVITKMTFGVVPNLFQTPTNNVAYFGFRDSLAGTVKTLNKARRDDVARSLGMMETVIIGNMRSIFQGGEAITVGDKLAARALKWTFFSGSEQANRLITGSTATSFVIRTADKAFRGKLRGSNRVYARRQFADLGLDLEGIVKRGEVSKQEFKTAIVNGVRRTQFQTDITDVPLFWRTPWGRVAFQFKTFAFNQAKLMRDLVFVEAAQGNYKPMVAILSVYPALGSVVGNLTDALKDRDNNKTGLARHMQNFSNVGGFGLTYNAFMASRFGNPAQFLLGPTVSDFLSFMQAVAQPDRGGVARAAIERQPIYQAAGRLLQLPGAILGVGSDNE
jgi:hypothetical protein